MEAKGRVGRWKYRRSPL